MCICFIKTVCNKKHKNYTPQCCCAAHPTNQGTRREGKSLIKNTRKVADPGRCLSQTGDEIPRMNYHNMLSLQSEICPICLDACSQGKKETCERGHTMHRICAMKMCEHMQLHCPLCRSMIQCQYCKSKKTKIWCTCYTCLFSSAEPIDFLAAIQRIIKSYIIWLAFAIIFYTFEVHEAVAMVLIITIHFNVMAHRVLSMRSGQTGLDFWAVRKNWGLLMTQIGLELLIVLCVATFFVRSISIWQSHITRYISGGQ